MKSWFCTMDCSGVHYAISVCFGEGDCVKEMSLL